VSTKKLIHDSKTLTSKGPNLEVKKKSPCEEQVSSSNTTIPCIHESMYKSMYKVRFLPMLVLGEAGPSREMSPFYREGIMQIPRFSVIKETSYNVKKRLRKPGSRSPAFS
jgi:hypothetical protein